MITPAQIITALSEDCVNDMINNGVSFIWLAKTLSKQINERVYPCVVNGEFFGYYNQPDFPYKMKPEDMINYVVNIKTHKIDQITSDLGLRSENF